MTPEQEERWVRALEMIAGVLHGISGTMALTYQQTFPIKNPPRDIDISHVPTPEERLGGRMSMATRIEEEDPLDAEGEEIGPYHRRWLEEEKRRQRREVEDRPDDARGESEKAGT
jgi:hypothetical protein